MRMLKIGLCALVASGFVFTAANAEVVKYNASLSGKEEVQPNTATGKGSADLSLDTTSKELTWRVSFEGLSGDAVAAHIHGPADPGANSGVLVNLGAAGLKSPVEGKATLTDAQIANIQGGKTYVNVHTAANKGGEIRGQIKK